MLSVKGSIRVGGRYNPPGEFGVLYTADSMLTALCEVGALFFDGGGKLASAPRDPELHLTLRCRLSRVLDLREASLHLLLGTSSEELTSYSPAHLIANGRGQVTPTQLLGRMCFDSGRFSALIAPSAANPGGFNVDIFPERLGIGEAVSVFDTQGTIQESMIGGVKEW